MLHQFAAAATAADSSNVYDLIGGLGVLAFWAFIAWLFLRD